MKYVIARSYDDFSTWVHNQIEAGRLEPTVMAKYVRDYSTLLGARLEMPDDDVVFLPGWEELPEARAIEEQVQLMKEAAGDQSFWTKEQSEDYFRRLRAAMIESGDPFVDVEERPR